jgi:mRNA-degrading endonuclease RelE of RelBE toxin-antitoxin system
MWNIHIVKEAEKELEEAPSQVRKKFDLWVGAIKILGPWLKGGFRTEALCGVLKGFYSVRLNIKWRVIFQVKEEKSIIVIRIVAHDYKSIKR